MFMCTYMWVHSYSDEHIASTVKTADRRRSQHLTQYHNTHTHTHTERERENDESKLDGLLKEVAETEIPLDAPQPPPDEPDQDDSNRDNHMLPMVREEKRVSQVL